MVNSWAWLSQKICWAYQVCQCRRTNSMRWALLDPSPSLVSSPGSQLCDLEYLAWCQEKPGPLELFHWDSLASFCCWKLIQLKERVRIFSCPNLRRNSSLSYMCIVGKGASSASLLLMICNRFSCILTMLHIACNQSSPPTPPKPPVVKHLRNIELKYGRKKNVRNCSIMLGLVLAPVLVGMYHTSTTSI